MKHILIAFAFFAAASLPAAEAPPARPNILIPPLRRP
jgi:hypothetical protein